MRRVAYRGVGYGHMRGDMYVGGVVEEHIEGRWARGKGAVVSMHVHNVAIGMGEHDLEAEMQLLAYICVIWL